MAAMSDFPTVRPFPRIRDAHPLFSRDGGSEHLGPSTFIAQEDSMRQTYRIIGWAALLAGLSYLVQPFVVALTPAVFGTSEVVTDPAVLRGAAWLASLHAGSFLGIAVGMGLLVIGMDELLDSDRSVTGRAHFLVGLAAAFGWLLVASASAARYSSVIATVSPFGEEGRSVFFLAQAMDTTTGVFVASIASGIWWIGTAVRSPKAGILGRPLAAFAVVVGAFALFPSLFGFPWGLLLQIPLFIVLGIAFLRHAGRLAPTRSSTEALPA